MNKINQDYIVEYIRSLIPGRAENFKKIEEYAKENYIPIVEPETGKFLELLVTIKKPKNILEVGTAIGYSALIMAEASRGRSHITSIEKNENMVAIARENISKSKYFENIDIICGDALEEIKNLEGKYDIIFIDAAKGQYKKFFDDSLKLLNENGFIVSDNILFKGMVAEDDLVDKRKKTIVKRLREYLDYISNREDLITSVIPIGDGVAITYREG